MRFTFKSPKNATGLFITFCLYWILPGHIEAPAFHLSSIGLYTILIVSALWLMCFALPWKTTRISALPYILAALAALLNLTAYFITDKGEQGLAARYYDNANFSGSFEKAIPAQSTEFTRIEPTVYFTSRGFSFFEQYFSLAFANDTNRRQWSANTDTSTEKYSFSIELTGYIAIPEHVTTLQLVADGGSAQMLLDGKAVVEEVAPVSPGIHKLTVRYARDNEHKPSLKLLWGSVGKKEPIPSSAFANGKQTSPPLKSILAAASSITWLIALIILLKHIRPTFVLNNQFYYWLLFMGMLLISIFDLQKEGRHFDFQIFRVGNDWLYYESFARAIIQGDWLSKSEGDLIFLNFGYRYILALLHWLGGEAPANALFLQRTFMAAGVTIAARAAHKLYGARTAIILVIMALACRQLSEFANQLLDTLFAVGLSFGVLYCLIRYSREYHRIWIIAASLLFGLSLLVRVNFLPLIVIAPLWIFFCSSHRQRIFLAKDISIFVAGALLIFSLIGVRNYLACKQWVFLPANGPFNLWLGNHPPEFKGPTYFAVNFPPAAEIVPQAINYSLSDPMALAKRILQKALYILGFDNKALYSFGYGHNVENRYRLHIDIAMPWLIACFGTISLWANRSIRPEVILWWLWVAIVNAPLLIFFPWGYGWRLSAPSFLPLYIICALSISHWSKNILLEHIQIRKRIFDN